MFKAFEFCLPTNATKVPAGPEWLHEIKHDGFRIRVEREGDRVRLITRDGYDWTKRYPWIAEAALKNRIKQLVIDSEAVCWGSMASPISMPCTPAGITRRCSFAPLTCWL
jgi:ATP-dependent DNA ligase